MELEAVRNAFLGLLAGLVVLAAWQHRRVWRALKAFFGEQQSATSLGLLRIFVMWTLLRAGQTCHATWFAALPEELRYVRPGWEPIADYIPGLLEYTAPAQSIFCVAALLGMLGLFSRVSCLVAGVFGVFVLGVPQMFFKVTHGLNVPVLAAFILAASPAGDACSLDALIRRLRGVARPGPSVAYSLPVRFTWLLLGTSYLFPGIAKLWTSGDLWIDGTRMRVSLFEKWAQLPDFEPYFRPDAHPWMLVFFGVGTLVMEIGFTPALFFRSSRALAGIAASGFHLGVGFSMAIWFDPILPLIVFLDFPQVFESPLFRPVRRPLERLREALVERLAVLDTKLAELGRRLRVYGERPAPRRQWLGATLVGSLLFYGMVWAGFTQFNSWPISIYPRFHGRTTSPKRKSFALTFSAKSKSGAERPLVASFYPIEDSSSIYRLFDAARRATDRGDEAAALDTYDFVTRVVLGNNPPLNRGERVVIRRFDFYVDPERRKGRKREYEDIAELEPPRYVPAPK